MYAWAVESPRDPAYILHLMHHPDQAAVARLLHLIDLRHQEPLCDVMWDDCQIEDELWYCWKASLCFNVQSMRVRNPGLLHCTLQAASQRPMQYTKCRILR
jgi:hypothetical protein